MRSTHSLLPAPLACGLLLALAAAASADPVDYQRQVKPILARKCYACHGPLKTRAGLRLDTGALIRRGGDSGPAVVPGKSGESLLVRAVTGAADFRMPPQGSPLAADEVQLLRRWVDEGAVAPDEEVVADAGRHWSFRPPARPAVPQVKDPAWVRNPVDAFVAAGHEKHGLTPAPPAARAALLRRVSIDLIGLPPTREELHAFLADDAPDAYERVVDRLLASPRHGERWGRHWMDVWRYSDWYGRRASNEIRYSQYHIWRWRDWIIESVNADKGYDRMVLEMLAGDELAPGDPGVLRATGFLGRNWYKFDRDVWLRETVEHTAAGFLALTLKCARCHDHKYDPISQEDYYRFRAFFEPHDVRLDPVSAEPDLTREGLPRAYDAHHDRPTYLFERGDDRHPVKDRPLSPGVPAALGNTSLQIAKVELPVAEWYPALRPGVAAAATAAAQARAAGAAAELADAREKVGEVRLALQNFGTEPTAGAQAQPAGEVVLADNFTRPRPDLWDVGHGQWRYADGRLQQTQVTDWAMIVSKAEIPQDFRARLKYRTGDGGHYRSVGLAFDVVGKEAFQAVYTSAFGNSVQAFHRENGAEVYPPAGIVATPVAGEITLDVAARGRLLNVWVNGTLKLVYQMPMARRGGRFALWNHSGTAEFMEVRVEELPAGFGLAAGPNGKTSPAAPRTREDWEQALQRAEQAAALAAKKAESAGAALLSLEARIAAERSKYATPPAPNAAELAAAAVRAERLAKLREAELTLLQAGGQDSKKVEAARQGLQQARDALNQPGATYTSLGPTYPKASTGRRLALAKWIASPDNPRTARVAVNHIWRHHFGSALVPTTANFGLAGQPPSHPELLDWLAAELASNNWSMKHVHRLIVTSNAYRMSSAAAPDSPNRKADPENTYLWRMNSRRMEAEVVRDSLLHLAGQLDAAMGGPELPQDQGEASRRRSVYFRVTPDDKMEFLELFDLANPNECYERRHSVIPQQALALLNSNLALAQARRVAGDLSAGRDDADFVTAAFEQVLGRPPGAAERRRCVEFLQAQAKLLADPAALTRPAGGTPAPVPPAADPALRARENLVHVLFNHNDFVTVR